MCIRFSAQGLTRQKSRCCKHYLTRSWVFFKAYSGFWKSSGPSLSFSMDWEIVFFIFKGRRKFFTSLNPSHVLNLWLPLSVTSRLRFEGLMQLGPACLDNVPLLKLLHLMYTWYVIKSTKFILSQVIQGMYTRGHWSWETIFIILPDF